MFELLSSSQVVGKLLWHQILYSFLLYYLWYTFWLLGTHKSLFFSRKLISYNKALVSRLLFWFVVLKDFCVCVLNSLSYPQPFIGKKKKKVLNVKAWESWGHRWSDKKGKILAWRNSYNLAKVDQERELELK